MLSFNNLGRHGRLGNQMFQYAAIKGIARNRGFDFRLIHLLRHEAHDDLNFVTFLVGQISAAGVFVNLLNDNSTPFILSLFTPYVLANNNTFLIFLTNMVYYKKEAKNV